MRVSGRWLSEDPIGFAAGDANLYRYVGNGPVNATDPLGLEAATIVIGVGGSQTIIGGGTVVAGAPVIVAGGAAIALPVAGYCAGSWIENNFGIGAAIGNWWVPMVVPEGGGITDVISPSKTGTPGSTQRGEGQTRTYGPDGNPLIDRDSPHDGWGDHCHDWFPNPNGGFPTRGPNRLPQAGDPPPPRMGK
jgi:hypothetical protein